MTKEEIEEKIWTRAEIQKAFKVGKNTVYEWFHDETCPAKKEGKQWTVFVDDFCDWYRNKRKKV